ncbi:MAG: YbjQ family protein [Clostridia bacterium]|nr:YbjQ family protein [Clostridia bacterium]
MFISTSDYIPGKDYEILGLVEGNTVRSRHIGSDIGAQFKNMIGGEIKGYVKMMNESRAIAKERLLEDAQKLGADAVIGFRYASASIMQSAVEIIAYATAVKFK